MASSLYILGTSHRQSPLELRDHFAQVENDLPAALDELKGEGVQDAVLLATCDRVELVTGDAVALDHFLPLVARRLGAPAQRIAPLLYRHEDGAALRHLFAVTSALDSLVIGEPHVVGQVRAAQRLASELGLVGPVLERAFAGAYGCARRVRRETQIAARPLSLAAAALDLARDIHGDLARSEVMLLGPSEMGELMAEHFRRAGVRRLVVCGPAERAPAAAQRLALSHRPLEELDEALVAADIVIAAFGNGRTTLTASRIAEALRRRRRRPIFVIDTAIPADAEPGVNDLDGAFLYDLADLERATLAGRQAREQASLDAWRIVDEEVAGFLARRSERQAVPAVVALRRHFERVRREVMAEHGLDAEVATRLLLNRLLHDPSEVLRELASGGDMREAEALLLRLFRLEDEEDEG